VTSRESALRSEMGLYHCLLELINLQIFLIHGGNASAIRRLPWQSAVL
jgi:hypothetical protein